MKVAAFVIACVATLPLPIRAQAARVELDHVYIVVTPGAAAEIKALAAAGLVVPSDTARHPGEGTASLAVLFDNAYLEMIWIDSLVPLTPDHAATFEWFRKAAAWRTTGHSPFGLGLRRLPGDTAALPVPVEREAAPWLGPDAAYEVLHQPADSLAADFFVVPARAAVPNWIARVRARTPALLQHPGGGHEITLVRVHGPVQQQPAAYGSLRPRRVEMVNASQPLLELQLDHAVRGQRTDFRPILPLVIVR